MAAANKCAVRGNIYENVPLRGDTNDVSNVRGTNSLDERLREDRERIQEAEEKLCWYHGNISREEARKILQQEAARHRLMRDSNGVFLVRDRAEGKCLSVFAGGRAFHAIIQEPKQGFFNFVHRSGEEVQGLECLIENIASGIWGAEGFHAKLKYFPKGSPPPPTTRKTGHTTLLHKAVTEGNTELVREILEHPLCPDINAKDSEGSSALHLAAFYGLDEMVNMLLEAGAYINMTDSKGNTALLQACIGGRASTVRLLVERGHCDPDIQCTLTGWTPLHEAAMLGCADCVRTLLSLKATCDIRSNDAETPRDIAEKYGRDEVCTILETFSPSGISVMRLSDRTRRYVPFGGSEANESTREKDPDVKNDRSEGSAKEPSQALNRICETINGHSKISGAGRSFSGAAGQSAANTGTSGANGISTGAGGDIDTSTRPIKNSYVNTFSPTAPFTHMGGGRSGAKSVKTHSPTKSSGVADSHAQATGATDTLVRAADGTARLHSEPNRSTSIQAKSTETNNTWKEPSKKASPRTVVQPVNRTAHLEKPVAIKVSALKRNFEPQNTKESAQSWADITLTEETKSQWLHSKLDQWGSEKVFRRFQNRPGLFLFREFDGGSRALSVITDGKPCHYLIEHMEFKDRVLYHLNFGPKFSCLDKLVRHFSSNPQMGLPLHCFIDPGCHLLEIPDHSDKSQATNTPTHQTAPSDTESHKKLVPEPAPRSHLRETLRQQDEESSDSGSSCSEPGPRRDSDDDDDDDDDDGSFDDEVDSESSDGSQGSYFVGGAEVTESGVRPHRRLARQNALNVFSVRGGPLYQWYEVHDIMHNHEDIAGAHVKHRPDSGIYENVEFLIDKVNSFERSQSETSLNETVAARRTIIREVFSQSGALQRIMWCEMPEVMGSGVLELMNEKQKKIQEAMFEIITSEASYQRSLQVLENVFIKCDELSGDKDRGSVITRKEAEDLFSNISEIRQISEEFLADLEARWQESHVMDDICDIITAHAQNRFKPYVQYCARQALQGQTLKRLLERPDFKRTVKELERHPDCQCLALYSFLMLPMQRITRLPLLVDALQHCLDPKSIHHPSAKKAFDWLQALVTECNEEARRIQQAEQMQQLKNKLVFTDVRELPSVTENRYLEKEGELKRITAESNTRFPFSRDRPTPRKEPLYIFVFNDLLVVTKKQGENFLVQDYCPRQSLEVQIITRKEAGWLHTSSGHPFLLTLHSNHKGNKVELLLSAASESERARWMETLSKGLLESQRSKDYEDWDCPQVVCVEKYLAKQPDELTLEQGDAVRVRRKMGDGWYWGEKFRDGTFGWFPAQSTVEIENAHVRFRNLRLQARVLEAAKRLTQK